MRRKFWQIACVTKGNEPRSADTKYSLETAKREAAKLNATWEANGANLEAVVMEAIID